MPLENGLYEIRYVPKNIKPPFVGGLYATSKDSGGPIYGEPLGQSGTKWQVIKTDGESDTYIITIPPFPTGGGPGPILPGWATLDATPKFRVNDLVILKAPATWTIMSAGPDGVYSVMPGSVTTAFMIPYLDVDKHNDALCIKTIPNLMPQPTTPLWQFIKVDAPSSNA